MRTKRYMMPKVWRLPVKTHYWAPTPKPGPHPRDQCIPLQVIVRDMLGYAETAREAKRIIKSGKVMVDKKARLEECFPVGLNDTVEFPDIKKYFRVDVGPRGIFLAEAKAEDAGAKVCRIEGKTAVKGGKVQLNMHDGRNIIIKDPKAYKCFDSVLISLPDQKILKHFPFAKGAPAVIIAGRNVGSRGKIKAIKDRKNMQEKSTVTIQTDKKDIETLKGYAMVGEVTAAAAKKPSKAAKEKSA
jgi:small subunit ribosomal protein S4e